jgi:hypothetical protein
MGLIYLFVYIDSALHLQLLQFRTFVEQVTVPRGTGTVIRRKVQDQLDSHHSGRLSSLKEYLRNRFTPLLLLLFVLLLLEEYWFWFLLSSHLEPPLSFSHLSSSLSELRAFCSACCLQLPRPEGGETGNIEGFDAETTNKIDAKTTNNIDKSTNKIYFQWFKYKR